MFPCPHCQQPIEVTPGPNVPWWNRELGNPRASLGCGTLILIGIIVALCAGGPIRRDLDDLKDEIRRLEKKVDALADVVKPATPADAPREAQVP